jgi:hypothetical protein
VGRELVEKRTLLFAFICLSIVAVLTTEMAAYYYIQLNVYRGEYQNLAQELNVMSQAIERLANVTSDVGSNDQLLRDLLETMSLRVNVLVKRASTDLEWHNQTHVPLGSTAITALTAVTNVTCESYGELGTLVTSVNGLKNNSTMGWILWCMNATSSQWSLPSYSADKQILQRGDVIAWTYESYASWPPPTPT